MPVDERVLEHLAVQMRVALVVRVDGDCRVAKHGLQTRRRDNDLFLRADDLQGIPSPVTPVQSQALPVRVRAYDRRWRGSHALACSLVCARV